jgi:hypothetical protein
MLSLSNLLHQPYIMDGRKRDCGLLAPLLGIVPCIVNIRQDGPPILPLETPI